MAEPSDSPSAQAIYQPQPQHLIHHLHNHHHHHTSPERRESGHQYHRNPDTSAPASNRLSYPPPARIRPDHSSHHSHHSSGRTSQQHEHHSRPPSDHSRKQHHAQNERRTSSTGSNVRGGHEARQYKPHESRRSTRRTVERVGSHDARHTHHRVSESRSQERLYNPDDDDEDDDELSPKALLRAMLLLSAPVPLLSLVLCIYSVMMIFLAIFISPLRLCIRSMDPFRVRVQRYLLRPLNMQRRLMKLGQVRLLQRPLPLADGTTPLKAGPAAYLPCNTDSLLWMHILSPLIAVILAFAAWVTSFVWLWSGMLNHESIADVSRGERRMARRIFNLWLSYLDWPLKDGLELEDWEDEEQKIVSPRTPEILEIKAPRPSV